jgi:hypothetical protein
MLRGKTTTVHSTQLQHKLTSELLGYKTESLHYLGEPEIEPSPER